MSNNAQAVFTGSSLKVTTGVTKNIAVGSRVEDEKTGNELTFVGKVTARNLKCPFVFVDLDTLENRRHSAEYIAKYID